MSRAYTVQEIDDLRRVMEQRYLFGTTAPADGLRNSRTYRETDMIKAVEEMVRTSMLAGITASDVRRADLPDPSLVSEHVEGDAALRDASPSVQLPCDCEEQ